ncbi:hypothetical protein [Halorientalis sp. IM1011]|uniref:hypothetical protein n=1 Tax=Halorientalis sp. IM1011 TaxID=1932360 RepID=UPI0012F914AD|nr:hypothetical protein [Halorientalis sp. IM1011]
MLSRLLARIAPTGEIANEAKNAIDYWREYKGKRIRIERVKVTDIGSGNIQQKRKNIHGIEGTVEKVMSLPPGFVLKDAIEFTDAEVLDALIERTEISQEDIEQAEGGHDRIFVSFSSVERITFVEEGD